MHLFRLEMFFFMIFDRLVELQTSKTQKVTAYTLKRSVITCLKKF